MTYGTTHKTLLLLTAAITLATAALMPAKAEKKPMKPSKIAESRQLSDNDKRRFQYFYYGAIDEQSKGHYAAAFDLLNHCLTINPDASEAYFSRGTFHSFLKQDSLAEQDQLKAVSLSPQNNVYRERLAQLYIKTSRFNDAIREYDKLYTNNYNRSDVLAILLQLYSENNDFKGMTATLDRMETEDGASEQLTMQKMQVYDMMGDKAAAEAELRSLVQKHPYDAAYKVMLGNWLMNNGRMKEAHQQLSDVLKSEPNNLSARMSMLDYYKAEQQTEQYNSLLLDLLGDRYTPDDRRVTLVRLLIADTEKQGGDSTVVIQALRKALSVPQRSATLAEILAAYMELKKMPQDSIDNTYRTVLAIDPTNVAARVRLSQSCFNTKDYNKVIELCSQGIETKPDEMVYYYFLSIAYSQLDKTDECLKTAKAGISHANSESNAALMSDFYSLMGDIYHEKGMVKEAYEAYDSCLIWKSDNVSCLNNYAYYLSIEDGDLAKAERMSYQTVQAEPQNTTFLDTYAWVLFKQKRYEEARIYIEEAIKCDTSSIPSSVILEHAGDITVMTGDTDAALVYWKRALELDKDNALLQRKIRQKKYIDK